MRHFLFIVVCFISLNAAAQSNSKLILGTWTYADIYEKEKADEETLRKAQVVLSNLTFMFTSTDLTITIMGKSETTKWNFSKANPKIILATSREGKPIQFEIISLTKDKLVIKMNAMGSLVMKKKLKS
ncbi:hypothetical protein [Flavobacterium sp. 3HN19-14]|uniref:hypothetical protein n=1 Tax=Flavobacterium sp. 3HN19-14 TaxID=3448133 RepID=UPI003EE22670